MDPIKYPNSIEAMYQHLLDRLSDVVPPSELRIKAEIAVKVNELKKAKNAIILGHNYMEPALYHSVCDYTGDSHYLAKVAANSASDIILFCGVRFMAETAKILNPTRKVLLPSEKGGCSLAEGISLDELKELKRAYPGIPVVSYVNTTAATKTETDYCCTSSNGKKVVESLLAQGHKRILFIPDRYLAQNVADEIGCDIVFPSRDADGGIVPAQEPSNPSRLIIGWEGSCEVHEQFTVEDIARVREQFTDAVVLAHPECPAEVVQAADFSGSTSQMIAHVENMKSGRVLLLTECSMGDNIIAKSKNLEMIRLCSIRCPHMNEVTLEGTLETLTREHHAIELDEETIRKARKPLDRMIEIS